MLHFQFIIIIIIYPLTARVVWAPQMISQPVFSIFPCCPLPSGNCRTQGLYQVKNSQLTMATYFETRSNSKKRSAGFCQVKNEILLSESCGRLEQPGTGRGGYSTHCQLFHGKSRRPLEESAVHLQMQCTGTLPYPTHAAVTFTFTLSLHRGCLWYTTNDYEISLLHFSLFSTALWDLANSRPVHSLILSSHLFFCLPCLLPPFTVPCKMVLARPGERETCP